MLRLYAVLIAVICILPVSSWSQTAADCSTDNVSGQFYFGLTPPFGDGSTRSAPLDGTGTKLDFQLRCRSVGGSDCGSIPTSQSNVVVCLSSGMYSTQGEYNYIWGSGGDHANQAGFTLGPGWRIHGQGQDPNAAQHTTLKLTSFVACTATDPNCAPNTPLPAGYNIVLAANGRNASGIEVSDLIIDANHDNLQGSPSGALLNLEGVLLRTSPSNHWIHNITVMHVSGDMSEQFQVWIYGDGPDPDGNGYDPWNNTGSLIENVSVIDPGQAPGRGINANVPGGAITAIGVNNATAEIRNNSVDGYGIGYGGWSMGPVFFHDNTASNTRYGWNIDSDQNSGVIIQHNKIEYPTGWGINTGGGYITPPNNTAEFSNYKILNNTFDISGGAVGINFQGYVQNSTVAHNTINAAGTLTSSAGGIVSESNPSTNPANLSNIFQFNQINSALSFTFNAPSSSSQSCLFENVDQFGHPRFDYPENSATICSLQSFHVFFMDSGNRFGDRYRDSDLRPHLRELLWQNYRWVLHDPSKEAVPANPPVPDAATSLASFNDEYGQHVFYLDTNQHVKHLLWNGWEWLENDLTALTNGEPAAAETHLVAFSDDVPNFGHDERVFYVDSNQHVDQLWNNNGGAWSNSDLTGLAGATPAAGSSLAGFADDISGFGHDVNLAYVGANQDVHLLWWSTNDWLWHDSDLTATTNAQVASAGSSLASLADDVPSFGHVQHVFYLGTNQHVHQLWWSTNNFSWQDQDLSSMTDNAQAVSGTSLTTNTDDVSNFGHNVHLYYLSPVGADQHVFQLWWSTNDWLWHDQDVTAAAGTNVPAQPGTALTSFADLVSGIGNTQNVLFNCSNGNLCQLWWSTIQSNWAWEFQDMTDLAGGTVAKTGKALTSFTQ